MLPVAVAWSSSRVTKSQCKGAILGVFFPIDNVLYSITFGTHTKMTEPIEVPFGLMTRVGPSYHVLDRRPDHPRGMGSFGGKVMGDYGELCKNGWTDRRAILDEDSGGPIECIRWVADPQEGAICWGCPDYSPLPANVWLFSTKMMYIVPFNTLHAWRWQRG